MIWIRYTSAPTGIYTVLRSSNIFWDCCWFPGPRRVEWIVFREDYSTQLVDAIYYSLQAHFNPSRPFTDWRTFEPPLDNFVSPRHPAILALVTSDPD